MNNDMTPTEFKWFRMYVNTADELDSTKHALHTMCLYSGIMTFLFILALLASS